MLGLVEGGKATYQVVKDGGLSGIGCRDIHTDRKIPPFIGESNATF